MIVRVLGAFLGIVSFAIMVETPKKYLLYAGIVGAVGWVVYLIAGRMGATDIFATFLSLKRLGLNISNPLLKSLSII